MIHLVLFNSYNKCHTAVVLLIIDILCPILIISHADQSPTAGKSSTAASVTCRASIVFNSMKLSSDETISELDSRISSWTDFQYRHEYCRPNSIGILFLNKTSHNVMTTGQVGTRVCLVENKLISKIRRNIT